MSDSGKTLEDQWGNSFVSGTDVRKIWRGYYLGTYGDQFGPCATNPPLGKMIAPFSGEDMEDLCEDPSPFFSWCVENYPKEFSATVEDRKTGNQWTHVTTLLHPKSERWEDLVNCFLADERIES